MKVRLLAAAGIAATIGVAIAPAQATPYAGQFRYLSSGTLAIQGADGARWLLVVGATQSGSFESRAEQSLYIDLSRCAGSACKVMGRWSRPLTDAEVTINAPLAPSVGVTQSSSARVRTVLGGRNLDVTLTGGGVIGNGVGGFVPTTSPVGVHPQYSQGAYAGGTVKLGALRCVVGTSQGAIGQVVGADTIGDDARDPRSAPPATFPPGFLKGKNAAHC